MSKPNPEARLDIAQTLAKLYNVDKHIEQDLKDKGWVKEDNKLVFTERTVQIGNKMQIEISRTKLLTAYEDRKREVTDHKEKYIRDIATIAFMNREKYVKSFVGRLLLAKPRSYDSFYLRYMDEANTPQPDPRSDPFGNRLLVRLCSLLPPKEAQTVFLNEQEYMLFYTPYTGQNLFWRSDNVYVAINGMGF